eukprot:TRINITY_DN5645_c0_g1_i1.p3 TRINITY_DN5645_c0_g1~~TRINITY_DN5645_c0_g1_i1.p3  ORF type:complete len:179 (+),score=28.14 TRINITY_DN5645_c0_g1_i1:24-539(+)
MQSAYPLLQIPQALNIVLNNSQVLDTCSVGLPDLLGKVLATEVVSPEALPPFRASIKDGYAVVSSDGQGDYPVVGNSRAGGNPQELQKGSVMYITTGAPLPEGADAVVQVEDTRVKATRDDGSVAVVEILKSPSKGQDIREIGRAHVELQSRIRISYAVFCLKKKKKKFKK